MSADSSSNVLPIGFSSNKLVDLPPKFEEYCRKLDQTTLIALLWEETRARIDRDEKIRELEKAKSENVNSFDTLFRKIDSIDNKFKFFANNLIRDSSISKNEEKPKPTYAEKAAANISFSKPELILATREALKEEHKRPDREKSVVISGIPSNFDVKLLPNHISESTDIPKESINVQTFIKNPSMVLVKMSSKEHVTQVFRKAKEIRKTKDLDQIRIRPDYSPSELALFRKLWSQAISLNNKANSYEWTVKGLQLVKLEKISAVENQR